MPLPEFRKQFLITLFVISSLPLLVFTGAGKLPGWESKFVQQQKNGSLQYKADSTGNIIPDFSAVGYYHGNKPIPEIPVVVTVSPSANAMEEIQAAIDRLSAKEPGADGFRGAILLKRGVYNIPGSLYIKTSGIVLRGEGNTTDGTKLIATARGQKPLIIVQGEGRITESRGTRTAVTGNYIPVGTTKLKLENASLFATGDPVILHYPLNNKWISDLKMDQITERDGTKQWSASEYDLKFERRVLSVKGNTIELDNPVMMPIEAQYGGAFIYKYSFKGRIEHIGIENLYCESPAISETDEEHPWDAINMDRIENSWVKNVSARYFAYSCVNLHASAKNITVTNSSCFDHKSKITGGRRYSFNNDGQQNLFMNCSASDGRHDYVTGARTAGPNVFYNCIAINSHADIGPHHRWAVGTLYDNINTDGEINVQDRGNYGTGHGWAGVTQVIWNSQAKSAAVQSPWVSGKNYCIGLKGVKNPGRFKDRPDAEWEGQNRDALQPGSLFKAQLEARLYKKQ